MYPSIEGRYCDGRIELTEAPPGVETCKVIVTFLNGATLPSAHVPVSESPATATDDSPPAIHHGRIQGTRISVYDVMDYLREGWDAPRIAEFFRLTVAQVETACAYIDAHRAHVEAEYQAILERCERGNPPEVQARLAESHRRVREWFEARGKAVPHLGQSDNA